MLLILIGVAFNLELLRQWIVDDRWMLFKETSRLSVIYYSIPESILRNGMCEIWIMVIWFIACLLES